MFLHMINYLQLSRKIMPLYCVIVQECGATDCFHALCLPFRYWALSKVQNLCLDVDEEQTWNDSFRCDEITPKVSYWQKWLWWYWKPKRLGLTQLPPQSESDSNFPGDDSETWSPTSEKQVSVQKPFARHDSRTNWLCKNFSPRVFVNSIFEIEKNHSLPETKTELLE